MDPVPKMVAPRRMGGVYNIEKDGDVIGYARFDSAQRLVRVPDGVIPDTPPPVTPRCLATAFDRVAHPRKSAPVHASKRRRMFVPPIARPAKYPPRSFSPRNSTTREVIDLTCDEVIDLTRS